jgi:hypothetical protein
MCRRRHRIQRVASTRARTGASLGGLLRHPAGARMGRSSRAGCRTRPVAMSIRCPQGRRDVVGVSAYSLMVGDGASPRGSGPSASTRSSVLPAVRGLGEPSAAAGLHPRHDGVCTGLYLASSRPGAGQESRQTCEGRNHSPQTTRLIRHYVTLWRVRFGE